jgi:hypothetical protein
VQKLAGDVKKKLGVLKRLGEPGTKVGATLLIIVSIIPGFSTASAQRLPLPESATQVWQQIQQQCPECLRGGFTACGSPDIGYGRAFAGNVLRGAPPRGYLITYVMSGDEFRRIARTSDYQTLMKTLQERFSQAHLVILEDGFTAARLISKPEIEVIFPAKLHECVQDLKKPWGCCVSNCPSECCEKDLGSPSVKLTWRDDSGGERIVFNFHHMAGMSMLERFGPRRIVYFCLVDQPGRLTLGRGR